MIEFALGVAAFLFLGWCFLWLCQLIFLGLAFIWLFLRGET